MDVAAPCFFEVVLDDLEDPRFSLFGGIRFITPADAPAPAGISLAPTVAAKRNVAAISVAAVLASARIPRRKLRSERERGK